MTKKDGLKHSAAAPKENLSPTGRNTMANPTNASTPSATADKTKRKREPNPALKSLRSLGKGVGREVQETFRCTTDEHNKMVDQAQAKGYSSMSDFFRGMLGLDPARTGS